MEKTIYIFSSGELKRKGNTLYFETEENRKYIPVEDTGEIMIFGEVDINKKLLEFLSQKEILMHYFNYNGYYMGTFYPREHLNSGYMILKQSEYYMDEKKRLELARQFVIGAGKNIRQVLKYYNNRDCDLEDGLKRIEEIFTSMPEIITINQLMALEGNMREQYYKCFDTITQNQDFVFEERSRRPPRNYMNTLVSFGNTLMYTTVLSEIYKTHLDPRIGFLHATNFRRFSLNLDVAEIFKPIIIDRLIFSLIRKNMVTKKDFDKNTEGIMLKDKAKQVFVQQMDEKLKVTIKHRELGRHVSYRRLIRLELYKLAKHLIDEKKYEPFIANW
ncbi:CRISPR-associated protein Cas1 [Desulfofarcimen acetoxidans DSM 771]|uniref:CRISPR-associated endonuclease Cas1 n=1 Tax=Desulfofarcimen acetoxidans (strain ATCC 49208 / DSM 771 / KCTC 5769 / VKM B-1644 / 5575) TaxID=485916 RepID=C8VZK8_DESAS|nr:type I-B CRISPR-associated endonuclease Cas1b [Desulfofarcimen acetoxidans]ACV64953.1 CRISPR-associated protein Cas1 [Desulfofarcimen acetoxidans DSM 771]